MSNLEKAKEIELDSKIDAMIEKYSKESVMGFLDWLQNMSETELNATAELCKIIDRVELNKQQENHQPD